MLLLDLVSKGVHIAAKRIVVVSNQFFFLFKVQNDALDLAACFMISLCQLSHLAIVILKSLILVHFVEHLLDAFGDFSIGASSAATATAAAA